MAYASDPLPPADENVYYARMRFTRRVSLGLAIMAGMSGCSEPETTISVSVRYWTDYLDPGTFEVTIEQDGQNAIAAELTPRQLEGEYDVVCQDDWRASYCRFFQRFEVANWGAGETTVTLTGEALDGEFTFDEQQVFDLVENEVNVVYFELEGLTGPPEPEPEPEPEPDAGTDAGGGGVESDAGSLGGDSGTDVPDAAVPATSDAGGLDGGDRDTGDAGVLDAGETDAGADGGVVGDAADGDVDAAG